jgi:hypothetical protein
LHLKGRFIACYLAASYTAEIKTKQGEGEGEGKDEYKAWIDSSNGAGELETNDDEYGYDYLMMPRQSWRLRKWLWR